MDLTAWFLISVLNSWCGPNIELHANAVCYDLDGDLDVDLLDFAEYQNMFYDCETIYNPDTEQMDCAFYEETYPKERPRTNSPQTEELEKDHMYGQNK